MSQPPPPWNPQGYPSGGQPPGQPAGPSPQGPYGPPPGYGPAPGYAAPPGYGPPPPGYGPGQGYAGGGPGYPPGPGGYGPHGPAGFTPPGQPPRKSAGVLIGIVVAGLVLLVAIGGIVMALTRGSGDQPSSSITPSQPVPPPADPSGDPSSDPSSEPSASTPPSSQPPSADPSEDPKTPGGSAVSLGHGISVTPASGWKLSKKGDGEAQLSNGKSLFAGLVGEIDPGSNPVQFCDAYHRSIAEKASNGKFSKAEALDLKSKKLKGASCMAQVTVSSGQGSSEVLLYSVVSVRTDGVTVVGTLYFTEATSTKALGDDFTAMVNSMLKGQAG